jgi:hypothetical protein
VKILFAAAAAEAFDELPQSTKRKAASSIVLLEQHPRMFRYFFAGRHLVYYSVNSREVRITAIIPGAMRRA